jgi:hypothetical protein
LITIGCVSLIVTIGTFSRYVAIFVSEVRNARKVMYSVYRELGSLSLCLESLRTDCSTGSVGYSKVLRTQLGLSLNNCDIIIQQMKDLLQKLQSNRLGRRIQWSPQCRDDMSEYTTSLHEISSTTVRSRKLCHCWSRWSNFESRQWPKTSLQMLINLWLTSDTHLL